MYTHHIAARDDPFVSDNEQVPSSRPRYERQTKEPTQLPTPPASAPTTPHKEIVARPELTESTSTTLFTVQSLRDTLNLNGKPPKCGNPNKKDGQPCKMKVPWPRRIQANTRLEEMTNLSPGSPEFEVALREILKLVHCRFHDSERLLDVRVQNVVAIYSPATSDDKGLNGLTESIRNVLGFSEAKCLCCNWGIGGQKVHNSEKTVDRICDLAADPDKAKDISSMLRILYFNRLCPKHEKIKVAETTKWNSTILDLFTKYHSQVAEDEDSNHPARSPRDRPQTPTRQSLVSKTQSMPPSPEESPTITPVKLAPIMPPRASKVDLLTAEEKALAPSFEKLSIGSGDVSAAECMTGNSGQLDESMPAMPDSLATDETPEDPNEDLRAFWPSSMIKSPLRTERYRLAGRLSPLQEIYQVASSPLGSSPLEDGYIYVYQVEGNEDYLKLGWTRSSADLRCKGWEFDCNRKTKILYPFASSSPVAVANARRVEALCHAELGDVRLRVDCRACMKWHIEWFKVSLEVAVKAIEKWSAWMASEPYEQLLDGEWKLKPEEKDRLVA